MEEACTLPRSHKLCSRHGQYVSQLWFEMLVLRSSFSYFLSAKTHKLDSRVNSRGTVLLSESAYHQRAASESVLKPYIHTCAHTCTHTHMRAYLLSPFPTDPSWPLNNSEVQKGGGKWRRICCGTAQHPTTPSVQDSHLKCSSTRRGNGLRLPRSLVETLALPALAVCCSLSDNRRISPSSS